MSHASVPLGEVAELIRGITYKPTDVCTASDDSAVACMRTKNVQESLDQSDIVWIPDSLVRRNAKYLKEGDILVSSANSWNLVGKACWVPRLAYGATAGGFISILRADTQKVDQRYLYHWLTSKSIQAKLRSCSNKTTNISNLDHARTLATEIPLPPLEEQRRIAAILDRISHLLMRAKDASTLNDQLQEAIFNYSFGEFEQAAAKYPTLKLEDVCSQITDGEHQTPLRSESGVKLLSARNIRNGKLDFSDVDYVPMEEFLRIGRRCAPVRGDVLISCSGSIGRVAVVDTDEPLAMVRSAAMARPVQAKVRPFFLLIR